MHSATHSLVCRSAIWQAGGLTPPTSQEFLIWPACLRFRKHLPDEPPHHVVEIKKGHAIFSTPARASDAALTLPTKSFKTPLCGPQLRPPQHVDPLPPVVANRCVRDLRGASTTPRTDWRDHRRARLRIRNFVLTHAAYCHTSHIGNPPRGQFAYPQISTCYRARHLTFPLLTPSKERDEPCPHST